MCLYYNVYFSSRGSASSHRTAVYQMMKRTNRTWGEVTSAMSRQTSHTQSSVLRGCAASHLSTSTLGNFLMPCIFRRGWKVPVDHVRWYLMMPRCPHFSISRSQHLFSHEVLGYIGRLGLFRRDTMSSRKAERRRGVSSCRGIEGWSFAEMVITTLGTTVEF